MQIPDGLKVYLGGVSFVQKQFDWNVSLKFSRLCPLIINFIYINAIPSNFAILSVGFLLIE